MRTLCLVLLSLGTVTCLVSATEQKDSVALTEEQGRMLVEGTPEFRRALREFRRPEIQVVQTTASSFTFQGRSQMPKGSGSGFFGNFFADRESRRIWRDIDRTDEIRSYLVRSLSLHVSSRIGFSAVNLLENNPLRAIRDSLGAPRYTLWGMSVGSKIEQEQIDPGVRMASLDPDVTSGQRLTGFRLEHDAMPIVEAYVGNENRVVEIYVEASASRESFDSLFGTEFTNRLLFVTLDYWETLLGEEIMVERSQSGIVSFVFVDAPKRGWLFAYGT